MGRSVIPGVRQGSASKSSICMDRQYFYVEANRKKNKLNTTQPEDFAYAWQEQRFLRPEAPFSIEALSHNRIVQGLKPAMPLEV